MEVAASQEVLSLSFSSLKDENTALRIYFPLVPGEFLFGLAPRDELDLRGKKILLRQQEHDSLPDPIPTVFSSNAWWIHVPKGIPSTWGFSSRWIDVRLESNVREILLGFGESPERSMESLCGTMASRYKLGLDKKYSGIGFLAVMGPVIQLQGSADEAGEILSVLGKARIEPGLLLRGQGTSLPETLISTLGKQQWEDFLTSSSHVPATSTAAALSLSFSGGANPFFPFLHSEAINEGSPASLHRLDLAAFGPLCQISLDKPGAYSREFWTRLIATLKIFALLKPYREACASEWEVKSIPALRHPALEFPASKALWARKDLMLFGRDLLLAPSVGGLRRSGLRKRKVLLPEAEWVHLWTSRRYGGGEVELDDPPGKPVVFFRKESDFAGLFDEIRKKATRF